jgi:hypothetical protein
MKSSLRATIKLRGHHLICLHFFSGEGYNSAFIENLRNVLKRAEVRGKVELCSGPDDICRKCPYLRNQKCIYNINAENEIREMDKRAITLLRLSGHRGVKWQALREKIPEILPEWVKEYCRGCNWRSSCKKSFMKPNIKEFMSENYS